MAVDVCSEISSPVVSPRISFSHDLKELDFVPVESHNHLHLNPTIDFDFCITHNLQISSADELFANGKILPVQIKKTTTTTTPPKQSPNINNDKNFKKKRLIEFLSTTADDDEEEEEEGQKPTAKPFWQFRRSSSVSCGRPNGGLLRSLQFLTRSNSTGSVPSPKPAGFAKVMQKQNSLKEAAINRQNSCQYYHYNKPCLGKSRSYGNGVRISPVLNFPPTYIARGTVSLFGIGSFFCSKKSKKKRK
ncbi:hypothetical protein C2S51_030201 [Perilla frutescens var. frutescens]|nr:hypothetical protein C2S51_030201 [Perilla frutescens var. frutescens]